MTDKCNPPKDFKCDVTLCEICAYKSKKIRDFTEKKSEIVIKALGCDSCGHLNSPPLQPPCMNCINRNRGLITKQLELEKEKEKQSKLFEFIEHIKQEKPNDRSELDRRYAILITELEKCEAYYNYYIKEKKNG